MEWAISLVIKENDTIEKRLQQVLSFIFELLPDAQIRVVDIDATGQIGSNMTTKMNQFQGGFKTSKEEVLMLAQEDGQVFELNLGLNQTYALIIRRGSSIDLVGDGGKPSPDQVGPFNEVDVNLFKAPH